MSVGVIRIINGILQSSADLKHSEVRVISTDGQISLNFIPIKNIFTLWVLKFILLGVTNGMTRFAYNTPYYVGVC